jgi:hypothetical protein
VWNGVDDDENGIRGILASLFASVAFSSIGLSPLYGCLDMGGWGCLDMEGGREEVYDATTEQEKGNIV